ncbi:MAG: four helix bundle protein [Prolixibacteraceae bacterium]|nr:four helix bundle protein [Prolixibacteraceae bacterium]MBT6005616.1 four helix bundle protein [Prolixibacteraceae bacterium]MBT6766264.1 four helix bundle protein [Prolixibacteraceae bacterium]MBT6998783.1 four helix bundle protein [Prolixibacteraceae bacterium]MBT7396518.1 four helix bundle protein [Prolixibacteraceae bacterium]
MPFKMRLEDLVVYQLAMEIGDDVYFQIEKWDSFQKWTTKKQLIEEVDSIAANIGEGYGKSFYKENRQFQYYSRGSQTETKTWLTKAKNRKLIEEDTFNEFIEKLDELGKRHNNYIKSIGPKPNDQ